MDAGPVTSVAADKDPSAAHGISRRIAHIAVDNDSAVVHCITDRVLRVAVNLNFRSVQVSAQRVARRAVNGDVPAGHARADIPLAAAVVNGDFFTAVIADFFV